MELYLQFAHGMKQITIDLSKSWGGATVILSPRDISPQQLQKWNNQFKKAGVKTLFDPQLYYPKSNHKGLVLYDYFDTSFETNLGVDDSYEEKVIRKILEYNNTAECTSFIIPSTMIEYDERWIKSWKRQCLKLIQATKKHVNNREHILTLALPEHLLLQKEDEIEKVISELEKLDVDGFYIVAHQPQKKYLVDTPMWLANLMQICAGLKLQGKKVIMGYGNHQLLCLSAAGVDAMATGTYLNARHFYNKFETSMEIKRKSVWYYYPAAMSEYKIGFLDVAYNAGVLSQMRPMKLLDGGYVDLLFDETLPSLVTFSETLAFKHYLHCVKVQMKNLSKKTYKDTLAANEVMLETAMRRIEFMERNAVYAQTRSFKDIVDVNRAALQRLDGIRGFSLDMDWGRL